MYSELWSIVDRGRTVFTWFFELIFFSIRLVFAGCRGVRAASRVVGRSIGPRWIGSFGVDFALMR